jgi:Alr-MurF fusion protein
VFTIGTISEIISAHWLQNHDAAVAIKHLVYDSRHIDFPASSLFFAIKTAHADGHRFLKEAYAKGTRNFVVTSDVKPDQFPGSNILKVDDAVHALQKLATHHRNQFNFPVIGITGSNGKTIVKEWLYQLLHTEYNIVRSPRSYNSQIGVPVSVWEMQQEHQLAIFEAGISKNGNMAALAVVIRPTIGILTNLGEAHSEGFSSPEEKLKEKLKLFDGAEVVIGPCDLLKDLQQPVFTWGEKAAANLRIVGKRLGEVSVIHCTYKSHGFDVQVPFSDEASIENAITCVTTLLYLGYPPARINERLSKLHSVDMRLQLKHGINLCTVINDSYSADLTSLKLALRFTQQQKTGQKKTVILSDIVESGKSSNVLYKEVAEALVKSQISRVFAIGENISECLPASLPGSVTVQSFKDTKAFIKDFSTSLFSNETILVKGARKFEFENIVSLLETKVHQTILEIDLNALAHNLKRYQATVKPGVKIMAMVKAFSYGSGSSEIASVLQHNHADYLGVAYADEGIELRKAGITLPVMVMNADESSFAALVEWDLQPVLYSLPVLHAFEEYLAYKGRKNHPVHIEIETGMNRLGFGAHEIHQLANELAASENLKLVSLFTHLAASEDPAQDDFTKEQVSIFNEAALQLEKILCCSVLKHVSNSAAIFRHPDLQMDMVRLGIGLYGIESSGHDMDLLPVAHLRSTIAQIKYLKAGDTVSYNRRGIIKEDAIIATVRIGYADGYSRRFSNGAGRMLVNGRLAPVIGTVCMDMTMLDVTDIPGVKEGDDVLVFGKGLPVQQVAEWAGTIPYEIMTSVSHRVKRVYFSE